MKVTESALVKRLNRKLDGDFLSVRKSRERNQHDLGTFYLLDTYRNNVVDIFVDLEELGREYKVLHELEEIAA
jgi:hypothetical protein